MSKVFDFTIRYVLPIESDGQPSPFAGFSSGTESLSHRVYALLRFPSHLEVLQHNRRTLFKFRLTGTFCHSITPLNLNALSSMLGMQRPPVVGVVSYKKIEGEVETLIENTTPPILHIKEATIEEISKNPDIGYEIIRKHAELLVEHFSGAGQEDIALAIRMILAKQPEYREESRLLRPLINHNLTAPNELPLLLAGFKFNGEQKLLSHKESDYINAILETSRSLQGKRSELIASFGEGFNSPTIDLIIACPGLLHHLGNASKFKNVSSTAPKSLRKALKLFLRQSSYTATTKLVDGEDGKEFLNDPAINVVAGVRAVEMILFTACLTIQSTNEFCPAIRYPPRMNRARGPLSLLGDQRRSTRTLLKRKIANSSRNIVRSLEGSSVKEFDEALKGWNKAVRVVADTPLEWLPVEGVPLMLRHYTSRISATPGGLLLQQCIDYTRTLVRIDKIEKLTVIRSFGDDDPLKFSFEFSFTEYSKVEGWIFEVEYVDVSTERGFIDACNSIESPFLIFDGHGTHSKSTQIGSIRVGNEDLDVWSLRNKVQMPPIVILSCCDTCPNDRSHATTANGFMALGAKTVFGPMLPVDAVKAGMMVSRLFYRLGSSARLWIDVNGVPLSWLKIVGSQIRASYTSELLLQLQQEKLLKTDDYYNVSELVLYAINSFAENWMGFLVATLSSKLEWDETKLREYLEREFCLPHALHYLQLGSPEKILFITRSVEEKITGERH